MDSHITKLIEHMISMSNDKDFSTEDRNICAEVAELLEQPMTRDDAIDAAHADPELNRVADLRTVADAAAQSNDYDDAEVSAFSECALQVIELCDAYIGLRAQCPAGSVVIVNIDGDAFETPDGEATTLFDAVVGALDFSEIHAYVSEVK